MNGTRTADYASSVVPKKQLDFDFFKSKNPGSEAKYCGTHIETKRIKLLGWRKNNGSF